jgi:hypothetical protein
MTMDKKLKTQVWFGLRQYVTVGLLALMLLSCTNEKTPADNSKTEAASESAKLEWVDMILRPTDTTQHQWAERIGGWPELPQLVVDSAGLWHIDDLTFAFDYWVFKDVAMENIPTLNGCRVTILIAARHIPDYQLIKNFKIDSVQVFEEGQTIPTGRRLMFPSTRKFLETVWQVEFVTAEEKYEDLDFPEGALLQLRTFASWQDRTFIFDLPPKKYEYITPPK